MTHWKQGIKSLWYFHSFNPFSILTFSFLLKERVLCIFNIYIYIKKKIMLDTKKVIIYGKYKYTCHSWSFHRIISLSNPFISLLYSCRFVSYSVEYRYSNWLIEQYLYIGIFWYGVSQCEYITLVCVYVNMIALWGKIKKMTSETCEQDFSLPVNHLI